jgi:hypothetical protein
VDFLRVAPGVRDESLTVRRLAGNRRTAVAFSAGYVPIGPRPLISTMPASTAVVNNTIQAGADDGRCETRRLPNQCSWNHDGSTRYGAIVLFLSRIASDQARQNGLLTSNAAISRVRPASRRSRSSQRASSARARIRSRQTRAMPMICASGRGARNPVNVPVNVTGGKGATKSLVCLLLRWLREAHWGEPLG